MNYIQQLGQNAARAKKQIAGCPTGEKNRILTEIAAILRANASEILKANEQDIAQVLSTNHCQLTLTLAIRN